MIAAPRFTSAANTARSHGEIHVPARVKPLSTADINRASTAANSANGIDLESLTAAILPPSSATSPAPLHHSPQGSTPATSGSTSASGGGWPCISDHLSGLFSMYLSTASMASREMQSQSW